MQNSRKMNKKETTNKKETKSVGQVIKLVLQLLFLLFLIAIVLGMLYFYNAYGKTILGLQSEAKQKVYASSEESFRSSETSLVYDAEGALISTLKSEKDVYYLEYEDIPTVIVDAMVVSEDRKFLEHDGIDYLANIRAAIELIKHKGVITQGASTITQQLARNIFLTHKVTYERKIEEIFVAQELEKKYTKVEIMEYYLNGIYFANGHYGIQAAARGYFGEGVMGLSLSQMVFLCAIPNNPNRYNPVTNMENTLERRDRILEQLREDKKITLAEYRRATSETIQLNQETTEKKNYVETYVYYCAIRALMKEQGFAFRYQFDNEEEQEAYEDAYYELYYQDQKDLFVKGYRIYTSINLEKQQLLQEAVDQALSAFTEVNDEGVYQMQGAAVCIDNDSGRVVAIVGGREQDRKGYTLNRGYQSFRQPGSSIKPLIVYTPSFERGYTPDSIVVDEAIKDGPKNSGGSYLGKIKLHQAIEQSKNTIAWKLFEELTPTVGLSYLLHMDFAKISESDFVPAAALGGLTIGASPVEMAAAYATIENDGNYREPTCIVKIMNSEGEEIVGEDTDTKVIYATNAARIMTETLTGVMIKGTGKGLGLTNTISAGKTGTTNDKKDGWFVGYTPYYTTSVWVGYDMPKPVEDLKGATYPGTIWHTFMEQIHDSSMTKEFDLYDWRAEVKRLKEENDKEKAEEDTQETTLLEDAEEEALVEEGTEDSNSEEEDLIASDEYNEDDTSIDEYPEEDGITEDGEENGDAEEDVEDGITEEGVEDGNDEAANSEDVNTEDVIEETGTDEITLEDGSTTEENPTETTIEDESTEEDNSGGEGTGDNSTIENTTQ